MHSLSFKSSRSFHVKLWRRKWDKALFWQKMTKLRVMGEDLTHITLSMSFVVSFMTMRGTSLFIPRTMTPHSALEWCQCRLHLANLTTDKKITSREDDQIRRGRKNCLFNAFRVGLQRTASGSRLESPWEERHHEIRAMATLQYLMGNTSARLM